MVDEVLQASDIMKSAKALVKHFKKANLMIKLPKRLSQSVKTRWNSSLNMLQSIECTWADISQLLIDRDELDYLNGISRLAVQELIEYLKRFKEASDCLEADTHPTIHLVLAWYSRLEAHMGKTCAEDSEMIKHMKLVGLRAISKKWGERLKAIHYASVLLDPRAKNSKKMTTDQRDAGKNFIGEIYELVNGRKGIEGVVPVAEVEDDFYCSRNDQLNELDTYLLEPGMILEKPEELLNYWRGRKTDLPGLSNTARAILTVPASSAASERSFSEAGFIINVRRTTLNPESVNKLLFLRSANKAQLPFGEEEDD